MAATFNPPEGRNPRTSPALLYVILGLIVAGILAFVLIKPNPGSRTRSHTDTAQPSNQ